MKRLAIVLLLNLTLIGGLVIVGLSAGSVGVMATGVDYLADASAIGISLLAIRHGHAKSMNLAALINATFLLCLNLGVISAAIERLVTGVPEVHGLPVLIVSAIAAAVMFAGALILGGEPDGLDEEQDLNVKAVLLDTAADASAAAGVAVTGGVILATGGWYWLDPAVALVIALVVMYQGAVLTWKVLKAIHATRMTPRGG